MWKCKNNESYPIKPVIMSSIENGLTTRSATSEQFRLNDTPNKFIGDATRLWNTAPSNLLIVFIKSVNYETRNSFVMVINKVLDLKLLVPLLFRICQ